jgi:pimeloyl-ACP methyl ester carboxylesterase
MKHETAELDDESRKTLPGQFVKLSDGFVHYELGGPAEGDAVVLVHGFSSPLLVWDWTFEALVKEGFRTLRYDLYGRGYSDRPRTRYNFDLFDRQLFELVNKLGLAEKKLSLVGLSMGGGICVLFADRHPELVRKISLVDPIGFPAGNKLQSLLKVPVVNRLITKLFVRHERLIKSQKGDFYDFDGLDEYLVKYREPLRYKGWLQAVRSTVLNTPFTDLREIYEKLGKRGLPMQLFWGERDRTIPFVTSQKFLAAVPSIEFHPVKESGHMPQYTHPGEVNPFLLEFLRS